VIHCSAATSHIRRAQCTNTMCILYCTLYILTPHPPAACYTGERDRDSRNFQYTVNKRGNNNTLCTKPVLGRQSTLYTGLGSSFSLQPPSKEATSLLSYSDCSLYSHIYLHSLFLYCSSSQVVSNFLLSLTKLFSSF